MSSDLSRMFLRLAAVAAVRGVTMAENRVFDSFIGADDFQHPEEVKPYVSIYTEQQDGDALSAQQGGPPFLPSIELVFETTICAAQRADDGTLTINMPETDGELEASLDMLNYQIEYALWRSEAPLSNAFRLVCIRAHSKQSIRFTSPKDGTKFAKRYAVYKCEIPDHDLALVPGATGLDLLPEPLADVARAWPDGPEKDQALLVASALVSGTPAMFTGFDMKWSPNRISPDDPVRDADHPAPVIQASVELQQ